MYDMSQVHGLEMFISLRVYRMIVTFDFFINALIGCILLPDFDEFAQCIDEVAQYEVLDD